MTRAYGSTAQQEVSVDGFQSCRALGVPSGGQGDPEGGCIQRFGAGCVQSFGLGGASDSALEVSSEGGSGFSGGDVGGA